ncbi:DUF2272 domain-containing protein [Pseudomonas synxantha]|uniref:Uncharacterized protein n=1 Tax=Pseudomonas synxantha TaxID=47883 RepID=A0ACC6JRV2_9PSED|nr:DUF2272 domain-containing protein [Pseudomonas synxantha]MDR6609071.1 hypothetical protein [Pseudomonas synxantha]
MSIIDTNDNVSLHLTSLKQKNVTAIGRYYSSRAWKRITRKEALDISGAGMKIFVVFEDNGDPVLTFDNGVYHAQIATVQARGVGQPEGSAIYFALEHLPHGYKSKHLPGIMEYVRGIKECFGGRYKVGVYSNGVVCEALLEAELCVYTWLSASSSFEGTKEFYASKRWSIAQDSHVDQNWGGVSVDVNEVGSDFGGFDVGQNNVYLSSELTSTSDAVPDNYAAAKFSEVSDGACQLATGEWSFFGRQTYDVSGRKNHEGHTEGEDDYYQRVGLYWSEGTNTQGIDGRNHDQYWSATFISWILRRAGAGARFRYSIKHSVFISQGIRDFLQKRGEAGYWTVRLSDAPPTLGDIVCWTREIGVDYDHQNNGSYAGHSDIVVAVETDQIWVIGGNVGNSVTRRPLLLVDGLLAPTKQNGETLFALMKNRF